MCCHDRELAEACTRRGGRSLRHLSLYREIRQSMAAWLALLVLASAPWARAAAPPYEPERWNVHVNITAPKVPQSLLLGSQNSTDGSGRKLFPLDGYDVTQQCRGPSNPFTSDSDRRQPGACEYGPASNSSSSSSSSSCGAGASTQGSGPFYSYWEKQPGQVMRMNNCYCYALNRPSTDWCDPGASAGKNIPSVQQLSCSSLHDAILADGGRSVTRDQVFGAPAPAQGHYIASYLRPQSSCNFARCEPDFHFLRLDSNGLWSQKMGESPVSNADANGVTITDPTAAKLQGAYTDLCGYYLVVPSAMNVGYMGVPDVIAMGLQRWKDAAIEYCSNPLPYDPTYDAESPNAQLERAMASQRLQQGVQQPSSQQQGSQQQQQQQQQGGSTPNVTGRRRMFAEAARGPRSLRLGMARF